MRHLKTRLGLALGATALTLAAVPALAQPYDDGRTVDEVTVVGHRGFDGRADTLSRAIDISDLDLRYDADVRVMKGRVRATARDLCQQLGETGGPGVTPSCVDAAVRGAEHQSRFAIALARAPVDYAYAAPPPYAGDYAPPASAVVPDEPPPEL